MARDGQDGERGGDPKVRDGAREDGSRQAEKVSVNAVRVVGSAREPAKARAEQVCDETGENSYQQCRQE